MPEEPEEDDRTVPNHYGRQEGNAQRRCVVQGNADLAGGRARRSADRQRPGPLMPPTRPPALVAAIGLAALLRYLDEARNLAANLVRR